LAPFLAALIIDLAMGIVLIVAVARLVRGHASAALLSYLFYLVLWYAMVLYMLVFLFAPRFLPEGAQRGYMLFNSIFVVPLNGLVAYFFVDFVWRWLERPMPRLVRFGLPFAFLVILIVYAREMLGRLSVETQSGGFVLSAPVSLELMFGCILLASLYGAVGGRGLKDKAKARYTVVFAAIMGGGIILGIVYIFIPFSFFGMAWKNAITSVILASVNVAAWIAVRRFFLDRARAAVIEFEQADLSILEARCGISPREREIISLVIAGKSNREIKDTLFISHDTVKKHIYNVYRKIGVRNRVQLVNAVADLVNPKAEKQ
jgi:DNA-binding CsgD family transcriptional regulator